MADIIGTANGEVLNGTADADTIKPGAGADTVSGLGGNDTIESTANTGLIGGGAGDDVVHVVAEANNNFEFDGDRDIEAGAFKAGSGATGTDTLKFDTALDLANTNFSTAVDSSKDAATGITHEGQTVTLRNVEQIEFKNVTLDLTQETLQYFSTGTVTVAVDGTAAATIQGTALLANMGIYDPNAAAAAVIDNFDETNNAANWTLTHINGSAVSDTVSKTETDKFTAQRLAGAGNEDDLQFTHNAKGISSTFATSDTFTVTFTEDATGAQFTQTVKVTHTPDDDFGAVTIDGTSGADSIIADATDTDAQTINGKGGNDTLDGDGGDDTLNGGDGDDNLDGDDGNDVIDGGAGNDVILGGAGTNTLKGGSGNDTISGGAGNDAITGGSGNDNIVGGGGTDTVTFTGAVESGALTALTATGTVDGTDTFATDVELLKAVNLGGEFAGATINGQAGFVTEGATDAVELNNALSTFVPSGITGIFGGHQSNTISGGGSSTLNVSGELFELKDGSVSAVKESVSDGWIIVGYAVEGDTSFTSLASTDTGKEIKIGSQGTVTVKSLKLSEDEHLVYAADTNDVTNDDQSKKLVLQVSNDTDGTVDASTIRHIVIDLKLLGENETKAGTDGDDNLSGGDGKDTIDGGKGNDTIDGGDDADNLTGGDGNDAITGGDGDDVISAGDGDDTGNGGDGADNVTLGKGNDAFYAGAGDDGDDTIKGDEGNDTIGGGDGDDSLFGGEGENLIFGGAGDDTIDANGGDDSLDGASAVWGGDGDDKITGGKLADTIGGGTQDDTIDAGDGDDVIYGGTSGRESITAGKGNDKVFASADRDTVTGGEGNDTIFGGGDADDVDGGEGNDELWGGAGSDEVKGGKGADTLAGGADTDTLTGGDNADTFMFFTGDGNDHITDFKIADDTLDLSGITGVTNDIINTADETKRGGKTGVLLSVDATQSIFLEGLDLGDIRDAKIVYGE